MKKTYLLIIIGIIAIVGFLIFSDSFLGTFPEQEIEILRGVPKEKLVLMIDNGQDNLRTFEGRFSKGMTVFDLLEDKTEQAGLELKTKIFDIGIMVEAIGDRENGEDGKYWLYYVNGEMPMVSVDKKEIKPGDKIEFKFEKSPF